MHTVSVTYAKSNLSEILNEVLAGEEVIITRRGRPIARIVAIKKPLKPIGDMRKFRSKLPRIKISSMKLLHQLRKEGY